MNVLHLGPAVSSPQAMLWTIILSVWSWAAHVQWSEAAPLRCGTRYKPLTSPHSLIQHSPGAGRACVHMTNHSKYTAAGDVTTPLTQHHWLLELWLEQLCFKFWIWPVGFNWDYCYFFCSKKIFRFHTPGKSFIQYIVSYIDQKLNDSTWVVFTLWWMNGLPIYNEYVWKCFDIFHILPISCTVW